MKFAIMNHLTGVAIMFHNKQQLESYLEDLDPDLEDITAYALTETGLHKVTKIELLD